MSCPRIEFLCNIRTLSNLRPHCVTDLAKVHAFYALASECWADRRTWTCLTSANDELDDLVTRRHFPGHDGRILAGSRRISKQSK